MIDFILSTMRNSHLSVFSSSFLSAFTPSYTLVFDFKKLLFFVFIFRNMRVTLIVIVSLMLIVNFTTAFPQMIRARGGPVDLSGLSGLCFFPPCPVQPFVFPEIDWDALHASIAQWMKEQE